MYQKICAAIIAAALTTTTLADTSNAGLNAGIATGFSRVSSTYSAGVGGHVRFDFTEPQFGFIRHSKIELSLVAATTSSGIRLLGVEADALYGIGRRTELKMFIQGMTGKNTTDMGVGFGARYAITANLSADAAYLSDSMFRDPSRGGRLQFGVVYSVPVD